MNFISLSFFLFFAVLAAAYYCLPVRLQNAVLLLGSYVFYMWRSPAAAILLVLGTAVAWLCGSAAEKHPDSRIPPLLACGWLFGALFVFKYLEWVLQLVLSVAGSASGIELSLILPIGISFYSFSLAGYVFDVYRGKLSAEKNLIRFAAYAAYFPAILSGPITRARELLPQLMEKRCFCPESFRAGFLRFLWGAAKKLILAAGLGVITDTIYGDITTYGGGMWLVAACLYSLQIYVDFAAYSDMAIGVSGMLGISLPENFRAPYLSVTVKDFWKKWHISLTSWFREYLYIPLGGSRKGSWRTRVNILIVFSVSGIWHGAGISFLVWGLLNGLYQVVGGITMPSRERLLQRLHISEGALLLRGFRMLVTFALVTAAWVFFRAETGADAWFILRRILLILRDGFGTMQPILSHASERIVLCCGLACCLTEDILIARGKKLRLYSRGWLFLLASAVLISLTLLFGRYGPGFDAQDFIYFKF